MSHFRTYTRICAKNRTIVMEVFPAQDVLSQKATVSSNFQLSNILPKFFYTLDSVTFKLSAIEKRA